MDLEVRIEVKCSWDYVRARSSESSSPTMLTSLVISFPSKPINPKVHLNPIPYQSHQLLNFSTQPSFITPITRDQKLLDRSLVMVVILVSVVAAFTIIGILLALFLCGVLDRHHQCVRSGRSQPCKYLRWPYPTPPARPPVERDSQSTYGHPEDSDVEAGTRGSIETLPMYEEPPPAYMAK